MSDKCSDCKGKGSIALLHSVVKCDLCGGTGETTDPDVDLIKSKMSEWKFVDDLQSIPDGTIVPMPNRAARRQGLQKHRQIQYAVIAMPSGKSVTIEFDGSLWSGNVATVPAASSPLISDLEYLKEICDFFVKSVGIPPNIL